MDSDDPAMLQIDSTIKIYIASIRYYTSHVMKKEDTYLSYVTGILLRAVERVLKSLLLLKRRQFRQPAASRCYK